MRAFEENIYPSSGRKRAQDARAMEFRQALLRRKQTMESSRPPLRALAHELGAAYQLLSFYFKDLPGWPAKCNAYSPWNR